MNQEIKTVVKKTAKVAGVTCVAAGAVALMTSAAAIKAMTEGAKYLRDTVSKILNEENTAETSGAVEAEEETTAESVAEAEEAAPETEALL